MAAFASAAPRGAAADPVNAPQGIAVAGYDVVSYVSEDRAVRGDRQFAVPFQGVTYLFASAAHRATFIADPTRYLPAYGGYAAYGVANGRMVPADPTIFAVIDGRIYLNDTREVHSQWLREPKLFISRANKMWPNVR